MFKVITKLSLMSNSISCEQRENTHIKSENIPIIQNAECRISNYNMYILTK